MFYMKLCFLYSLKTVDVGVVKVDKGKNRDLSIVFVFVVLVFVFVRVVVSRGQLRKIVGEVEDRGWQGFKSNLE